MTMTQITSNPFAQMMDREAVMAAVGRSERLQRLSSRICRPLDRVLVTATPGDATEFDAALDGSADLNFGELAAVDTVAADAV